MSYDLAVWEGEMPKDDAEAGRVFADLYERYVVAGVVPPAPKIAVFVESLLTEYPDLDDDPDNSPWSVGNLIGDASGPLFCLAIQYPRAAEVHPFVTGKAREHSLVCFDPQSEEIFA